MQGYRHYMNSISLGTQSSRAEDNLSSTTTTISSSSLLSTSSISSLRTQALALMQVSNPLYCLAYYLPSPNQPFLALILVSYPPVLSCPIITYSPLTSPFLLLYSNGDIPVSLVYCFVVGNDIHQFYKVICSVIYAVRGGCWIILCCIIMVP